MWCLINALILLVTYASAEPTRDQADAAEAAINTLLENNKGSRLESFFLLDDYPFIAGLVRLAFHDCVGGKCDGCINIGLSSNNGLSRYLDPLRGVYDNGNGYGMSFADFIAFASVIALEKSTSKVVNDGERFKGRASLRFNRQDCATSPLTDATANFPSAHGNFQQTVGYFSTEFGFTPEESIALLGAHSLGRARLENSGFEGRWTSSWTDGRPRRRTDRLTSESTLDNQYYKEIDIPWKQLKNGAGNFQWHTPPVPFANKPALRNLPGQPTMLFNSDFCMKWEFNADTSNGGKIDCATDCLRGRIIPPFNAEHDTCCRRTESIQASFQELVDNNARFIQRFTDIFMKMVNRQFDQNNPGVSHRDLPSKQREPSKKTDFLDKYSTNELEEILDELMETDKK